MFFLATLSVNINSAKAFLLREPSSLKYFFVSPVTVKLSFKLKYAISPGSQSCFAISSASTMTASYSSFNIFETVLLPELIPPVKPINI
ncbi:hypothetical protein D3C75_540720 [compost metagenome]